jgi:uncharacterized protein
MKNIRFLIVGVFFGIILTKGEAISWYRIQEMFRFESFHMFGIFMTAIPTGAISLLLIRKMKWKTFGGDEIAWPEKKYHHGVIIGSLLFGFGWALTGACPGPIYAQIGTGFLVTVVTLLAALLGTWCYAYFQKYLPD